MFRLARPALAVFLLLTLLTGLAYPLLTTGLARLLFPAQAAGSLLLRDGKPIGSALLGQQFEGPGYFWGRLSATTPQPYNAANSGGSNLGPLNPALLDAVKARIDALHKADPGNQAPVPVDLVTASASGLDPDLSIAAARYQAARVATARGLPLERVETLIDSHAQSPLWGFLGEPHINVLDLNLALDRLRSS